MNINSSFPFNIMESEADRPSVVVFSGSSPVRDEIVFAVKERVSSVFLPKRVILIVREKFQSNLAELLSNSEFSREIENLMGDNYEGVVGIQVSGKGEFQQIHGTMESNNNLYKQLLREGMLEIFRCRKGLISSSSGYHFSKPSGDHCDKFIRASNLLVSSTEVIFLAISLLPHINQNLKRVYIDTSSIAYLVATAVRISSEVQENVEVIIESFESYTALKEDYDFIENPESLVVISATTSGSLGKKLLDKHNFVKEQIITFLYSKLIDDQIGLLDILEAVPGGIISGPSAGCEFCKNGSRVIRISGDQFLPETPRNELLVIRKTDFSASREKVFSDLAAKEVLSWNKFPSSEGRNKEHFYIDVEKALGIEDTDFSTKIDKVINRYLSRHLDTIVSVDSECSLALAKKMTGGIGDISLVSLSQLEEEDFTNKNSILVVAGVITSGRKLLSVSRKLREMHNSATVTYVIGFCKLPTKAMYDQLEKDLRMGGHEVVVLCHFPMPRIKEENVRTSWEAELEILTKYSESNPLQEQSIVLTPTLSKRLELIQCDNLDQNQLFLESPVGATLLLRDSFSFWSSFATKERIDSSNQSDVYWTIQAILHDLRSPKEDKGLATVYHTTLISPVCFDRFNRLRKNPFQAGRFDKIGAGSHPG